MPEKCKTEPNFVGVCFLKKGFEMIKKSKHEGLPSAYLDDVRRDDSSYWAAALVLAIKSGNRSNELSARANLKRLGFDVVRAAAMAAPDVSKGGAL